MGVQNAIRKCHGVLGLLEWRQVTLAHSIFHWALCSDLVLISERRTIVLEVWMEKEERQQRAALAARQAEAEAAMSDTIPIIQRHQSVILLIPL
mgnify:CR=1 FL=1